MTTISKKTVLHISLPIAISITICVTTAVGMYYKFDNRIEDNNVWFNHISSWINEHEIKQKDIITRITNLERVNTKINTDLEWIRATLVKIENKL